MKSLLHLDSSLRNEDSNTRVLSAAFAQGWRGKFPEGKIIYRDFAKAPLPHLTTEAVAASYKDKAERTASDLLALQPLEEAVDELLSVDHILIAAPMYNFTVPSSIKTWVDHIVYDGRTFSFGPNGPEALVKGKRVFVVTSHGGSYAADSPWAPMNMLGPWLKNILGFLGMTEMEFISIEGADFAKEKTPEQLLAAQQRIAQLVEAL